MALNNCKLIGSGGLENLVKHEHIAGQSNVPDQELHIIPDEGYVVSAIDFSVSNITYTSNSSSLDWVDGTNNVTLTDGINSITLSDTGTAGEPGNKIKVVVDLDDTYTMPQEHTTLNIDIDGDAVDNTLISVIPHVENSSDYVLTTFVEDIVVTPVANASGVITMNNHYDYNGTSTVKRHFNYFDCIIKPGIMTKLATIVVECEAHNMELAPPTLTGIDGGDGNLRYDLIEVSNEQDPTWGTGGTYKRTFDFYYQDDENNTLPANYNTEGYYDEIFGCFLNIERPTVLNIPVQDESGGNIADVIHTFDFHNDLQAEEMSDSGIPDKVNVVGLSEYDISVGGVNGIIANPNNPAMSESVGTIVKATEDEPNLISIVGTPGATFTLAMVDAADPNTDKTSDVGLPTGTQIVPASGVFVTELNDIASLGTGPGKNWDLTITAGAESTISTSAHRPQMTNSSITAGKANSTVMRFVQPKNPVKLKVTGSDNSMQTVAQSTNIAGEVSGLGTSKVSTQSYKDGIYEIKEFTLTRTIDESGTINSCEISGTVVFERFGTDDITLDINFSNHFTYSGGKFTPRVSSDPQPFYSAGMSSSGSELPGSFVKTGSGTGYELAVINLSHSFTNG